MKNLLAKQHLHLTVTDAAKDLLAEEGYDPVYGARPLKRVIAKRVMDELAVKILDATFAEGDHILIDAHQKKLSIGKGNGAARDPSVKLN